MILVEVNNISVTDMGFVIFLKNNKDKRFLPIFISSPEAQSISITLEGNTSKRPLTHDLIKNMLSTLGKKVDKVVIDRVYQNTFYAKIYLEPKHLLKKSLRSKKTELDARPSDAIAIALRFGSNIYVSEDVFETYAILIKHLNIETIKKEDVESSFLENPLVDQKKTLKGKDSSLEDVNKKISIYKKMLKDSIKQENFEEAAKLRDQIEVLIKKLNQST